MVKFYEIMNIMHSFKSANIQEEELNAFSRSCLSSKLKIAKPSTDKAKLVKYYSRKKK